MSLQLDMIQKQRALPEHSVYVHGKSIELDQFYRPRNKTDHATCVQFIECMQDERVHACMQSRHLIMALSIAICRICVFMYFVEIDVHLCVNYTYFVIDQSTHATVQSICNCGEERARRAFHMYRPMRTYVRSAAGRLYSIVELIYQFDFLQ
jgi:hypothetical protein